MHSVFVYTNLEMTDASPQPVSVESSVTMATVTKSLLKFKKQSTSYKIQPFDLILIQNPDAIGKLIQQIESKYVNHNDRKPDGTLWTHVGIILNKTVLPLDCLEQDKLYIYESIFTGTVLGYTYSRVFPVDHPFVNGKINHSGPQLRPLVTSCLETMGDIAIAPLKIKQRQRLFAQGLPALQEKVLAIYSKYKHYGYPMSVIPQFAAASDDLYDFLNNSKKATKSITQGIGKFLKTSKPNYNQEFLVVDPASSSSPVNSDGINSTPVSPVSPTSGKVNTSNKDAQPKKKKAVFCSQLAALFYEELECDGFTKGCAGKFTPVELVKSASFESEDHYIKKGDKFLVGPDGQTIID